MNSRLLIRLKSNSSFQDCHPERSEAKAKDLLLSLVSAPFPHRNGSYSTIMQWLCSVLAIALFVALPTTGCKKKTIDPFPATGAIAGWEKVGDARTFDAKNLYQYIDGDAEQYIAAGVVTTSTADYKFQGTLEAVVDVHTMSAADGARKIFETGQTSDAKTIQLGDAGIVYAQSVIFRKGPYLVRIVAYESTPGAPQALLALAHGVEGKL